MWATYKGAELGRTKPFDQLTLTYAVAEERAGAEVDVYLDAKVTKKTVEGTKIGTFVLAGTGGSEKMKSLTIPVKIDRPGVHTVTVQLRRANSKLGNALGNLDKLTFGYAADKS